MAAKCYPYHTSVPDYGGERKYFYRHAFATMDELRAGVADYINFYNHQRRCANAGGASPIRYEVIVGSTQPSRINRVYSSWGSSGQRLPSQ